MPTENGTRIEEERAQNEGGDSEERKEGQESDADRKRARRMTGREGIARFFLGKQRRDSSFVGARAADKPSQEGNEREREGWRREKAQENAERLFLQKRVNDCRKKGEANENGRRFIRPKQDFGKDGVVFIGFCDFFLKGGIGIRFHIATVYHFSL